MSLFADITLTLHKSQFIVLAQWSHETAVHLIHSFGCKCRLQTSGANCSTISVHCVTMTWQHIFNGSLQVTVVRLRQLEFL